MGVGRARSIALQGLEGAPVEIEADTASGLPAFALVGLPDTALGEAKARVRSAIGNSGFDFPAGRVTVNLSPASLPKTGAGFDLGIAIALLAADGLVDPERAARAVHLGELGLDGRLRPSRGILPMVLAAARAGFESVIVPAGNAGEAALVPGIRVVPIASLRGVAIHLGAELDPIDVDPLLPPAVAESPDESGDLADVVGNRDAVEAVQIAAAGGHHMFLLGPPGAGKTMVAARLPGILPDLDEHAALEVSCVRSLSGLPVGGALATRPPLEAPHHSASPAAIVGGGSGVIRPGAAARAAHGILFLDEAPEFAPSALDSLRQPLESGVISISRVTGTATFPARFQLLLAANPCPCGNAGVREAECSCTPSARRRYLGRLSGPLLDRVDIRLNVPRVTAAQLRLAGDGPVTTSAEARTRVVAARERAARRLRGRSWRLNAHAPGRWLRGDGAPSPGSATTLDRALERGALSMRGYDRVLRVAWTLADLDGVDRPGLDQIGRALYLRTAGA
ncbi:YifB family Mg chelatase-like AAA ATPase [Homoserinibacter sp. GY 40078]|uniref:YifB family Mg chelatase-like AAA ATPase n=1 Tax=Homoserinibacter sp. GY 40078 TaxID=2603275 RepID=UPI0011CB4C97|nr:YifB family Mg chelatase-like AAA ATPase [Homoserinibacter sp. GY 40078]TXK17043.1 YifB family Mg chelatase-like AAA ATPase [Homoserinibacter sp. GY 40078]